MFHFERFPLLCLIHTIFHVFSCNVYMEMQCVSSIPHRISAKMQQTPDQAGLSPPADTGAAHPDVVNPVVDPVGGDESPGAEVATWT